MAARAFVREFEMLPDDDDDSDVRLPNMATADVARKLLATTDRSDAFGDEVPLPPAELPAGSRGRWLPPWLAVKMEMASERRLRKRRLRAFEANFFGAKGRRSCTKDEWGAHWDAFVEHGGHRDTKALRRAQSHYKRHRHRTSRLANRARSYSNALRSLPAMGRDPLRVRADTLT